MKQIEDKLCKYCNGCNKLELETFSGVMRCNNFTPGIENWQNKIREELKKRKTK